MRQLTLLLTVLTVSALSLAACGDEDSVSSATSLVPAGAVLYGEATLEPRGDQKEAIDTIVSKFPGSGSAGERLERLIEQALRESDAPLSYKDDIQPWLGSEAAFFVSDVQASDAGGAAMVATDDEDAAEDALRKSAQGDIQEKTYKGVEYLVDDVNAGMVHDGFVVLGEEADIKAVIDTTEDGSSLEDDDAYTKALEDAPEDRLGLFYVNSPALYRTLSESAAGAVPLGNSFRRFFEEPYVATVDADHDGVTVEASIPESFTKAVPFFGPGSEFMTDLPVDSWLALAQPDFGKTLDSYIDAFADSLGGRDVVEQQFRSATGLDLRDDVLSWMGDVAIFVRGTSIPQLNGALLIETSDEVASGRLIERLRSLAQSQTDPGTRVEPLSAPGGGDGFMVRSSEVRQPVHVFQRDGRVVFAYGDDAASDAISPGKTLDDAPDFTSAAESLEGYAVSMYVAIPPILELVQAAGAGSEQGFADAKPYLEPLGALIGGTKGEGDDLSSAFKLTVP
ncbi:MAG TPA: DUF3352 domain-containing protein [Thermoleophilaceae bacterium]|nr:DUF3352 domain-containing protein [Thermoleophilaceae bacterium]